MQESETHIILVTRTYPSGAQEWYCPTCGRRFIVQWTPEYSRVVLECGDECAIHNTDRGAFIARPRDYDDQWLGPWIEWLQNNDLESHWEEPNI